jgi:hypothetical protein
MATPTSRRTTTSQRTGFTPLGIIATFVALSETVAGLAAVKTSGLVQILFAVFSIFFPVFIAGVFFAILWKRAYVLYPPKEFGAEVDVRHYVEAMRHQAVGNQELHVLIRETISQTLASQTAQSALLSVADTKSAPREEVLKKAADTLVDEAVDRLQRSIITVDISAFADGAVSPQLVFPYQPDEDAFSLLSAVYYQISDHVRPFTYGKSWVLQNTGSDNLLLPTDIPWADNHALADSGATVRQMGILAGMSFRAVPMPTGRVRY